MKLGAIGIQINNLEEGRYVLQALKSEKFGKIIKFMMFNNSRIDWNTLKTFKREVHGINNCRILLHLLKI